METTPLPTVKLAQASTADITKSDTEMLSQKGRVMPTLYENEYGYIVHVNLDEPEQQDTECQVEGFSRHFVTLLQRSREAGAGYLQIDRDNEKSSDAPEW